MLVSVCVQSFRIAVCEFSLFVQTEQTAEERRKENQSKLAKEMNMQAKVTAVCMPKSCSQAHGTSVLLLCLCRNACWKANKNLYPKGVCVIPCTTYCLIATVAEVVVTLQVYWFPTDPSSQQTWPTSMCPWYRGTQMYKTTGYL